MTLKKQQGFLSLISVGIIVVVAIITSLLTGILTGGMQSDKNIYQVQAAFNLANSALQIAKRDILANNARCENINRAALYTNANLNAILGGYSGEYTLDCMTNTASTTLANDLGATTTNQLTLNTYTPSTSGSLNNSMSADEIDSISIVNANGFATSGIIKIDDEYIHYADKSGNFLQTLTRGVGNTTPTSHAEDQTVYFNQGIFYNNGFVMIDDELIGYSSISADGLTLYNLTRGVGDTTPTTHNANTTVVQNQTILTVVAAVPSFSEVAGSKTLQEILFTQSAFFGSYLAAVAITGTGEPNVTLGGNTRIINDDIRDSDPNFPGCTLITTSSAQFNGNARTRYENGFSTPTANDGDILLNSTVINRDSFPTSIFAQDISFYINTATITTTPANFMQDIATATENDIVVVNGDLTIDDEVVTSAKMLIIDGNLTINDSGQGNDAILIGTDSNPTTLIVTGNFTIPEDSGRIKCTIKGILYVGGDLTFLGNVNQLDVEGFTGIRGNMTVDKLGNFHRKIEVLETLQNNNNNLLAFNYTPYGLREIFH